MQLQSRYDNEIADLHKMYEERYASSDFKTCLDIKVKIAKLDAIYFGKDSEQTPVSFKTQQAVVKYLMSQGYKINDSTLSYHISKDRLIAAADGAYKLEAVLAYAEENLTNMPEQAKSGRTDDTTKRKKEYELEMARLDLMERQGKLVNADDMSSEIRNMLVTFRTRVLQLPRKLSHHLADVDEPYRVEEILDQELRGCLICLSDYKVDMGEG